MNVLYSYVCPKCLSPALDVPSALEVNGHYTCRICKWTGQDACVVPQKTAFQSKDDLMHAFSTELIEAFAANAALPIGQVLVRWGLVPVDKDGRPSAKILAVHLKEMARAMAQAVVTGQEHIEKSERSKVS